MGLNMNGIQARPMAVVMYFRVLGGKEEARFSVYNDSAHILLMVKPGITTEAKLCHKRVSTAVINIFLALDLSDNGIFCEMKKNNFMQKFKRNSFW